MQELMAFTNWFLEQIPNFLWSDAIKPLWGLLLLGYIFKLLISFRSY